MKNDIIMSTDQSKAVVLVLLDLSVAFDTVDHNVLFSLTGKTVWFVKQCA